MKGGTFAENEVPTCHSAPKNLGDSKNTKKLPTSNSKTEKQNRTVSSLLFIGFDDPLVEIEHTVWNNTLYLGPSRGNIISNFKYL